ncbi:unnamed protein product [Blepharisma stoltei]|uniref:Uncharacterized protein n=1 Tax=Blepharisma stoltei TaxID=1481888 RepID=A0AAU9JT94_9CILI|nr:unnamed protein product [Blepharisma stoltei]
MGSRNSLGQARIIRVNEDNNWNRGHYQRIGRNNTQNTSINVIRSSSTHNAFSYQFRDNFSSLRTQPSYE